MEKGCQGLCVTDQVVSRTLVDQGLIVQRGFCTKYKGSSGLKDCYYNVRKWFVDTVEKGCQGPCVTDQVVSRTLDQGLIVQRGFCTKYKGSSELKDCYYNVRKWFVDTVEKGCQWLCVTDQVVSRTLVDQGLIVQRGVCTNYKGSSELKDCYYNVRKWFVDMVEKGCQGLCVTDQVVSRTLDQGLIVQRGICTKYKGSSELKDCYYNVRKWFVDPMEKGYQGLCVTDQVVSRTLDQGLIVQRGICTKYKESSELKDCYYNVRKWFVDTVEKGCHGLCVTDQVVSRTLDQGLIVQRGICTKYKESSELKDCYYNVRKWFVDTVEKGCQGLCVTDQVVSRTLVDQGLIVQRGFCTKYKGQVS